MSSQDPDTWWVDALLKQPVSTFFLILLPFGPFLVMFTSLLMGNERSLSLSGFLKSLGIFLLLLLVSHAVESRMQLPDRAGSVVRRTLQGMLIVINLGLMVYSTRLRDPEVRIRALYLMGLLAPPIGFIQMVETRLKKLRCETNPAKPSLSGTIEKQ